MQKSLAIRIVKNLSATTGGLSLFAIVRNEDYLLPFFFDHYRSLGVENFLVYDDHSDDRTMDFLRAQADCAIVTSEMRFGDQFGRDTKGFPRRLPHVLKESLPETMFPGRWVVTVDADEFLILPSPFSNLRDLTNYLDRIGQPYATAPLVDFYGETLGDRNYARTVDPFAANPYFDIGPYYVWNDTAQPTELYARGVRNRILQILAERYPEQISSIYGRKPFATKSWKVPLLKQGSGVRRIGDHEITVAPSIAVATALAHFKFHPSLDAKIDLALSERQYAFQSVHYAVLDAARRLIGSEGLVSRETRRFEGPRSLEQAGLMRCVSL